jgi:tRNA(adenine34) deaminase
MAEALDEAELSLAANEFPVGAVLVLDDVIVARAHWAGAARRRMLDHPELLVLLEAERTGKISLWDERQRATLYTTLEPCVLCMGAAMTFLLGRFVFAAPAPPDGAAGLPDAWQPAKGHPPAAGMPYTVPAVVGGVECDASVALIREWVSANPGQSWARGYLPA